MSHSKMTKRGRSQYVDSWNPRAKKFIVGCAACGRTGFQPHILDPEFPQDAEHRFIRESLEKILEPLELDDAGLCAVCADQK